MDVVKFKECNVIIAENQSEYFPLPAHKTSNGIVTSCWKLSFLERFRVALAGKLFLQVMTFNRPLQPLKMSVNKPFRHDMEQPAKAQRQEE
jgi:hypothetical protein